MPFPIHFEGLEIPGMKALGFLIAADLRAGGGTVRDGALTIAWLQELAAQLSPAELHTLIHTLLSVQKPATVALGIELALALQIRSVGPMLVSALQVHDLGLLLAPGPDGRPLENLLGLAAAQLADLHQPALRGPILHALRSAGAHQEEAWVLASAGSVDELRRWAPDLLFENNPDVIAIFSAFAHRPEIALVLPALADGISPGS